MPIKLRKQRKLRLPADYLERVLGAVAAPPIGFWPGSEASGAVALDLSPYKNPGAYSGVLLGQPGVPGMEMTCPLYDGAASYTDIHNVYKIFDYTKNLILNPSFETNTTGWAAAGSNTIAQSTDQAKFGSNSLKCTYNDDVIITLYAMTLTAAAHAFGAWVYIPSDYDGTQVRTGFEAFVGATGITNGNADMSTRDQWQYVTAFATPVGGDLEGVVIVRETGTSPTAGKFFYIDGVQVEARATVTDYTDGSLEPAERYGWTGAAHASTSTRESGGKEGGMLTWGKTSGSGVWTDGLHHLLAQLRADDDNRFDLRKQATNGRLAFNYKAAGTVKQINLDGQSSLDWMPLIITWSLGWDEFRAYLNGVQIGSTLTGLGAWAGNLESARSAIGAGSTGPVEVWDGSIGPTILWAGASAPPAVQAAAADLAVV